VSVAAEIIALQWGGDGGRLTETSGPIHQHAAAFVDDAELADLEDDATLADLEDDAGSGRPDDGGGTRRDPDDDSAMTRA
jgi:hypothetical protein